MLFEQGRALLIGSGALPQAQVGMPITVADAEAIASVLSDSQLCGYPKDQVRAVLGEQATRAGILAALDELAATATPGHTVFFFYSGHSAIGSDDGYHWVCQDTRIENERVVAGTGVGDAELLARIKAIPAGRMLIVINSPLSPLPAGLTLASSTLPSDAAAALLSTGKECAIITACQAGQVSHLGNGLLTIFTQALFDGLRGRDRASADQFISSLQLFEYVQKRVCDIVLPAYDEQQEPQLIVRQGSQPFPVALYQHEPDQDATASALRNRAASTPAETLPAGAVREVEPALSQQLDDQITRAGHSTPEQANPAMANRDHEPKGSVVLTGHDPEKSATYLQVTAPDHQILVDLIHEIRRAIVTSGLAAPELAAALSQMDLVDEQMTHSNPQLSVVRDGLNAACEVMQKSSATNADIMATAVQQALAQARKEYA